MIIGKRGFDANEVLARLRREGNRSKDVEGVIQVYEEGMNSFTRQMKEFLSYGANQYHQINETNPNDDFASSHTSLISSMLPLHRSDSSSSSSINNNPELDRRLTGSHYSGSGSISNQHRDANVLNLQKWRVKAQEMEGQWNMEREQRERTEGLMETQKSELETMRIELKTVMELNQKQLKTLLEKDDELVRITQEATHLKQVEDKHVETIHSLQDQLEKKIAQMTAIEDDRNQLIERFMLEKNEFALRMNELNLMQEELNAKMKRLAEDEEYLMKRKLTLNTEIVKSGVKIPSLAPTIEDSKVSLQGPSEVPSKPQKSLLKLHKNEIYQVSQTLNGSLIATCGGDNQVKLYDPLTMTSHGTIQSTREDTLFLSTMFAPFNELMIAGLTDKTVQLYSYTTCKLKATFQGHNDRVNVVSFSSEKEKVISGSADRSFKIWDVNKGSTLKAVMCGSVLRSIDYFQSEPHFVSGHNDGSIRMYSTRDSANTKPIFNLQGVFDGGITCTRLSNCHNYVLASSADGFAVKAIDLRKNKIVNVFENQQYFNNHEFNKCCFGPDDKYVIAGCADSTVFIWDFNTGQKKSILKTPNHQGVIIAVDFHNVSGNLYTGDSRGNLVIWS